MFKDTDVDNRGGLFIGQCAAKHRSATHRAIALPSAGAELYAAPRAISEAKRLMSLGEDFGEHFRAVVLVDGQATIHFR